jgi:hypothetical protein
MTSWKKPTRVNADRCEDLLLTLAWVLVLATFLIFMWDLAYPTHSILFRF